LPSYLARARSLRSAYTLTAEAGKTLARASGVPSLIESVPQHLLAANALLFCNPSGDLHLRAVLLPVKVGEY
jgi:hypothetical protein